MSKFKAAEIVVQQIEYNRNGVGGDGFYAVKFTTPNDRDFGKVNFIGIVPSQAVTTKEYRSDIYVISPKTLELNWRGADYYGDKLIKAIIDHRGYEEE